MTHIDYNRSLLSLVSSVLTHYGVTTTHATLPELDVLLAKNYKNVVVMLFDGMGTAILKKHLPPEAFLRRYIKSTISSVFPPTTTAATITMETGLSPIEHGWLGWSLYFEQIGANVNIFPNTLSGTGGQPAADYNVARKNMPYKTIFEKIAEETSGSVKAESVSPFSIHHIRSIEEICETVETLCVDPNRKYIYTYWYQPDYDMHDLGIAHEQITANMNEINNAVELLSSKLSDTLIIVTADHGLVDTDWRFIPDYPEIGECLVRMPSIEARAMTFFVKTGMNRQFEAAFIRHFGDCYILLTKEQVIDNKLFGDGIPHPCADGFIGDYLAIAISNVGIESSPSTRRDIFKAAHAGLTDAEINVPFIAIECPA